MLHLLSKWVDQFATQYPNGIYRRAPKDPFFPLVRDERGVLQYPPPCICGLPTDDPRVCKHDKFSNHQDGSSGFPMLPIIVDPEAPTDEIRLVRNDTILDRIDFDKLSEEMKIRITRKKL